MSWARRGLAAVLVLCAAVGASWLAWRLLPRDGWSWLPREGRMAGEGREVARRFGYDNFWEVTVALDDPFAGATRAAVARWQEKIGTWPEVDRLVGPAELVAFAGEGVGRPAYAPIEGGGAGPSFDASVRAALRQRPDARGWFFDRDERKVRLYLGWRPGTPSRERLHAAAVEAGLWSPGTPAVLTMRPLWPTPAVATLPWTWRAALGAAGALLLVSFLASFVPAVARRRRSPRRLLVGATAAAFGFALPFVVAPSWPWRAVGVALGLAASTPTLLGYVLTSGRAFGKRAPVAAWLRALGLLSCLLVAAAVAMNLRHRGAWLTSDEAGAAPLAFVVVEADWEDPVVLAEVARFTDLVRAAPQVADAWSPADAFVGAREGFAHRAVIPPDKKGTRRLWQYAAEDGALVLSLSPGRDAGLLAVRLRPEITPAARRAFGAELARALEDRLRTALLPVNVEDPSLPAETRVLGRGILAADAKERIVRLATAAGKVLSSDQALGLDRVTRQAAFVPTADPSRLADAVDGALEELTAPPKPMAPWLARPSLRRKVAAAIAHQPWESGLDELAKLLAGESGRPETETAALAATLFPRVSAARFDEAAALNVKALAEATGLPGDGEHAAAIEGALIQGMGPVVGLPVPPDTRGARQVRAWEADPAAADRELARTWGSRCLAALAAVLVAVALLWLALMGREGLVFAAISCGPVAVLALIRAFEPRAVTLPFLLVVGAALASGLSLAVAWASPFVRAPRSPRA